MPAIALRSCADYTYVNHAGETVRVSWHGSKCQRRWRQGRDGWVRFLFSTFRCYCPCGHKDREDQPTLHGGDT